MGDAEKHDPREYLDRAERAMAAADGMVSTGRIETEMALIQEAGVWASMATAAAMLMPTPEEVIETYRETAGEVLDEVQGDLVKRIHAAREILDNARRDGGRRHPAILAALEALGSDEG